MVSDIWLRTILIVKKETRCLHIGYSYRLRARVLLYAPSHRQDNTYHGLCYTSRGALAGTRNRNVIEVIIFQQRQFLALGTHNTNLSADFISNYYFCLLYSPRLRLCLSNVVLLFSTANQSHCLRLPSNKWQ